MTTRFPGPTASPGFQLWRVTLAWQRAMTAALAPYGLTHTQFVLLACSWWLGRDGGLPVQTDLARQAGTDARTTSQVLRTLETDGWVRRVEHPHDSRARRVQTTTAGHELLERAMSAVEDADERFFGPSAPAAMDLLGALPGALVTMAAPSPVGLDR